MDKNARILIAGAGSIGCFVGGVLAAAGRNVALLGRGAIAADVQREGLRISDADGLDARLPPERAVMHVDPAILADAQVIFVTVKSGATEDMASLIANSAPGAAIIVSLQNGVGHAERLRAILPGHEVRAGMVPFNVIQPAPGHFRRATNGKIMIGKGPAKLARLFDGSALEVEERGDIDGVLWGKLLVNLNNAVNALSGVPLKQQLENRQWRLVVARQLDEGLATLKAAGIEPKTAIPIPIKRMPTLLRLPNFLFTRVAKKTLNFDPEARSSMADDFARGRTTEVEALQGAIIALAERHGVAVPVNRRVRDYVRAVEREGGGSPRLSPSTLVPDL
ncbi:2-dehydropantoate 2-reductase [Sphingomicrobium flavum]|uniref:2-dehydropantoate 2-reductase n=1 Tax=Sphingomicrobium flavum TaxID=1229164 RepID=UPI0021AD70ED|nr:2-dehydropantoate 2-reductase [Sphingomicrobium flavum]